MAKPTILIVDDEDNFRESLSEVLEEEFHVLTASSVRDGLSIVDKGPLSLILLDLQMPGLTGVDMLKSLRSLNNNTPVFILTGNSCQEWAERCADLTVQGYVKKPVDVVSLICRIKKVLGMEDFEVLRELWGSDFETRTASISPTIKKALIYIQRNHEKDFTREEIAAYLGVSPDYLSRQFHRECGIHLKEYCNAYRIYKSKRYLMDSNKRIADIAASIGIPNMTNFCRLFKKLIGLTPTKFTKVSLQPQPFKTFTAR
jgi:two-component system response regulator YesN